MIPQPPEGQGPVDPRGAFSPPPPPPGAGMNPVMGNVPPGGMRPPAGGGGYPPMQAPLMMPPMMPFYPPPPPPRGGGFARAILVTLATAIFGLSLAANVYLLMLVGFTRGESAARANVLVSGDATQKIAVIPISGIMDGNSAERFERLIKQVENDRNVKALVIEVDSPGGAVTAADSMYHRILQFKQNRQIPVITSMGGLAASGGYYVACATDEIYAQPTTITGSIGVVYPRFDLSGTLEKWGARETTITPEGADFKNADSMFKPDTPETTSYLRAILNDTFARFKTVVTTARQSKLTQPIENIANGKIYTAGDAQRLGLVDGLKYPAEVYDHVAQLAGLKRHHVVRYEQQPSLLEALGVRGGVGSPKGQVNITLDPSLLRELTTPRVMYLWRGE